MLYSRRENQRNLRFQRAPAVSQMEEIFMGLCHRLKVDEPEVHWKVLKGSYAEPNRFYHTMEHIEDMWGEFDQHRHKIDWNAPMEWAIFWHDAFYSTKVGPRDNESISSSMAFAAIQSKSPEFKARVDDLIMSTTHLEEPAFEDAAFICDIDLKILGVAEPRYDTYAQQIREEYFWVLPEEYREARVEILQGFLHRGQIYYTDFYRQKYELTARHNIVREIQSLSET